MPPEVEQETDLSAGVSSGGAGSGVLWPRSTGWDAGCARLFSGQWCRTDSLEEYLHHGNWQVLPIRAGFVLFPFLCVSTLVYWHGIGIRNTERSGAVRKGRDGVELRACY